MTPPLPEGSGIYYSMTPSIRGGVESMTPSHLLVAPPPTVINDHPLTSPSFVMWMGYRRVVAIIDLGSP